MFLQAFLRRSRRTIYRLAPVNAGVCFRDIEYINKILIGCWNAIGEIFQDLNELVQ